MITSIPRSTTTNTGKELLDLIHAKVDGAPRPEPEDEKTGEVVDLMEALRASAEQTKKARAHRPRAKKAS